MIANSMRRDRFKEILKYIHAANYHLDSKDKYVKLRPFIDIINDRFLCFSSPFGLINISIDESIIPYYGRHQTKQFIRGKNIWWGYKAWVASELL